jgi:hypothetical protein
MWYEVHQSRYLQYDAPFVLPTLFRSNTLVFDAALNLDAAFPYGKRSYKYAGRLTPVFEQGIVGQHRGKSRKLYLGRSQIEFENPFNYDFYLQLDIHLWTPQLDLTIWESDEQINVNVATELFFIEAGIARIEQKVNLIEDNMRTSSGQ